MKLFSILFLTITLIACASITIDEQTGLIEYKRTGNQELHGILIEFEKSAEGAVKLKAKLGDQKSDREIAEVLIALSENLNRALEILMELQNR